MYPEQIILNTACNIFKKNRNTDSVLAPQGVLQPRKFTKKLLEINLVAEKINY